MMVGKSRTFGLLQGEHRRKLGDLRRRMRYLNHIALRAGLYLAWHRRRIRWAHRAAPEAYTDADPFAIVNVPTREIRFEQARRFDKFADAGRVIDGDWDRDVRLFEDEPLYQACLARFARGTAWEDTAFVQAVIARIEAGEAYWHGCRSRADVQARCRQVEALYESIAAKGYRRLAEVNPNSWRAAINEVTVNIGRDGTLIRNSSGMHRLCVARVLGIAEIPVRILVRHRAWHERRGGAAAAEPPAAPASGRVPARGRPAV